MMHTHTTFNNKPGLAILFYSLDGAIEEHCLDYKAVADTQEIIRGWKLAAGIPSLRLPSTYILTIMLRNRR